MILKKLTSTFLAELFSVSKSTAKDWKCGRVKIPGKVNEELKKIDKFFNSIRKIFFKT